MLAADPLEAVIVNLALAGVAIGARLVRPGALWGGVLVGCALYLGAGRVGFGLLVAFFAVGVLVTRLGYRKKESRGLAEAHGGRRGSAHALANAGVPALAAMAMLLWPQATAGLRLVLAGALAAALADTAGTEIGQLLGRRAFSLRSLREVPPGTAGAVSVAGTAAGAAAAAFMGAIGGALGFYPPVGIVAVAVGGLMGTLLESAIAGLRPRRGPGHMTLNLTNTLAGGVAAAAIFAVIGR